MKLGSCGLLDCSALEEGGGGSGIILSLVMGLYVGALQAFVYVCKICQQLAGYIYRG